MRETKTDRANACQIERPICARCGSKMWLARVTLAGPQSEFRTFECPVCEVSIGESCLATSHSSTS